MSNNNRQTLKYISYTCLTLTSLLFSASVYGDEKGNMDHDNYLTNEKLGIRYNKRDVYDELERKPTLLFERLGVQDENEIQKALKKPQKDKKALKKETLKAARHAAKKAAYDILKNKEEAKLIVRSIIEGKKLKDRDNERENRLFHLAQNLALNAAIKAAYERVQNENLAEKVVKGLNLGKHVHKYNPYGKSSVTLPEDNLKVMTLQDLEAKKKATKIKSMVLSHLDKAKLGTEYGLKGTDLALKIIDLLLKFKII